MKKFLLSLILIFLSLNELQAQQTSALLTNFETYSIFVASASCGVTASCVWMKLATGTTTAVVTLSGTFAGTFIVEQSGDGGVTFSTVATYTSVQTAQSFTVTGMTDFRVRCSAYTSGVAVITISSSPTGTFIAGSFNPAAPGPIGITTPSSGAFTTVSATGAITSTFDGVHAGYESFVGNTANQTVTANTVGFMGPTSATFTAYALQLPSTGPTTAAPLLSCVTPVGSVSACSFVAATGGSTFPVTVSGAVNSGGIPCFNSTTNEQTSVALTANVIVKGGGAGACPTNSLATDDGTQIIYTGTGGIESPIFESTGSTAGFIDFPQGTTSSAIDPCNVATSICEQAPTAVTSYLVVKPGVAASGVLTNSVAAAVDTQGFSGDAGHSTTVSWSTATSLGSTSLCSTALCPAGTYRISAYIDVTTACTTTGSYLINIIYTDDTTVSKTTLIPLEGTGSTFATGVLVPVSTTDYGQATFILRSTGAASINYSTTAAACGSGGPGVGKLYLTVEPIQ
jgi:hypothetical protein